MKNIGLTDSPATQDQFGIDRYIDGLSKFIQNCETPMTISIQGSWGSGKTSIMTMIQDRIKNRVIPVFFNTWQFSQFSLGNVLPISMIKVFIDKIAGETQESKGEFFKRIMKKTQKPVGAVLNVLARSISGGLIDNIISSKDLENNDKPLGEMEFANAISNLHEILQETIIEACENEHKDRVVVFIDDLDRLVPGKAMELLEVLKIFFDCSHCVFVLAIDYDVVIRGAAEKYGFKLNDKKEAEKGRAFFDKIIQVPFKMPVVEYDIKSYLEEGLKKINVIPNDQDLPKYQRLCTLSLGTNPRGLKRLLNAFLLLNTVRPVSSTHEDSSRQALMLFGLLCMQQFKENIYNLIVRVNKEIADNAEKILKIIAMLTADNSESLAVLNETYHTDIADEDVSSFGPFFEEFLNIIGINPHRLEFMLNDEIDPTEEQLQVLGEYSDNYMVLSDLLKLSATTANEDVSAATKSFSVEELNEKQRARFEFWVELKKIAENNPDFISSGMRFTKFKDDIWLSFASGSSKVGLTIRQARRDKNCFVHYSFVKDFYAKIYSQKDDLNKETALPLQWTDPALSQRNYSVNYVIHDVPFDNREKMQAVYVELIDALIKMKKCIAKYLN